MNVTIKVDLEGQRQKSATLRRLPAAQRVVLQRWAADTVKAIRQNLRGRFLSVRTGNLWRSVGRRFQRSGDISMVTVGTNVSGKAYDVPYARIQDEGGWVVAKKRFLTIPLAGYKGVAANVPRDKAFFLRTASNNLLLCERTGKRAWKARFMLVRSVKIPASHWFTQSILEADVAAAMQPDAVWAEASRAAFAAEEGG